jgi:hypothetical protein
MSKTPQDQQEVERLRASLQSKLQRAPEWINGASVQAVREWKKNYDRAKKTAAKKSPTAGELQSAIQSVS